MLVLGSGLQFYHSEPDVPPTRENGGTVSRREMFFFFSMNILNIEFVHLGVL